MKILDIGCGDKCMDGAIGIDKNYPCTHIMDLDISKIPYKNGYFDLVISEDSLEHFGNPKHVFSEVNRVLRKYGRFNVKTVNVSFWLIKLLPLDFNRLWRHKLHTKRTGHLIHWTPDMLRMWMELNGFKVQSLSGSIWQYQILCSGVKI